MNHVFADLITIGDELMIGQVIDTNSSFIASELTKIGVTVRRKISISDNKTDITDTLNTSLENSDILILTGGLGPTSDDITKGTLNEYFGGNLIIHEPSLIQLKAFFDARGAKISERNRKQAELPDCCIALTNRNGTAPGMLFKRNHKLVFSLPGVPFEMKSLIMEEVIPILLREFKMPAKLHTTVLTTGLPESTAADMLNDWESNLGSDFSLAYLPSPAILKLRVSIIGDNIDQLKLKLNSKVSELIDILGANYVFGNDDDTLELVVGKKLLTKNYSLSLAESCTGGEIAHLITSVSGSSQYFKGSIVAYSNEVKVTQLHVNQTDINNHGAVSQQVVEQMAIGVRKLFNTTFSIATSGIAGPDGGSDEKPVGTTWIAIAGPDIVVSKRFLFGDNRKHNITRASLSALNLLRLTIDDFIKNSK